MLKLTKLQSGRCCFVVVIRCYKCLFCKLGTNWLKFHQERNALAVAVIWKRGGGNIVCKRMLLGKFIFINMYINIVERMILHVHLFVCVKIVG